MGGCCSKWGPGQHGDKDSSKGGNTPKLNRLQHKESFSQQKNGVPAKGDLDKGIGDGYSTCYSSDPVKPISDSGENSFIVDNLEEKLELQSGTPSPDLSIKADLESDVPEENMHLNSEVSSISGKKSEPESPKLESLNKSNNLDESDTNHELHTSIISSPTIMETSLEKGEVNCDQEGDSEKAQVGTLSRSSSKSLIVTLDNAVGEEMPKITSLIGEEIDGIMSALSNSCVEDGEFVTDVAVVPEPKIVPIEDGKATKVESNIIVNPLQDSDESTSLTSYVQTITIESTITEENKIENRARSIVLDDLSVSAVEKIKSLDENIVYVSSRVKGDVDKSPQSEDVSCASKSVSFEIDEDLKECEVLGDNVSKKRVADTASNINVNVSYTQSEAIPSEVTDGDIPKHSPQLSVEVCEKAESKGEKTNDNGEPNDSHVIEEDEMHESRPGSEASIMSQSSIYFEKVTDDQEPEVLSPNSKLEENERPFSVPSSDDISIYENFERLGDLPPPPPPEEMPPPPPEDEDVTVESSVYEDVSTFPPPPQDQDDLKLFRDQMLLKIDHSTKDSEHVSPDVSKTSYHENLIAPPCSSYVALVSPTGFGSSSRY